MSITRKDMFVHDMVHNNPGLVPYDTNYIDPEFLKKRGYDAKVFELFDCAQFGLLWDVLDEKTGREKIFPYNSAERKWVEDKKSELLQKYSKAKNAGLEVYFMMDIIVLPCVFKKIYPELLDNHNRFDLLKPMMSQVLEAMFDEMFSEFPMVDGIYVRYGETYVGECYGTPYHIGNNPIIGDGWEYHKALIDYLQEYVCKKNNKKIMYRTWGFGDFQWNPEYYLEASKKIPVHPNFYFCIKYTKGDFQRTFPFNQSLNVGEHNQIIEVQAAREYEGKGAFPDYIADGVINGFEEHKWLMEITDKQCLKDVVNVPNSTIKGIWTWSRGGGWDGPYINGKNGKDGEVVIEDGSELWNDLNAYVISHWAKDTSHSDKYYAIKYAKEELGMGKKDAEAFYEICIKSAHAILLGRATNSSEYPYDVFWTRDQNINYSSLLENIKRAKEKDCLDLLLYQQKQSVKEWKQIVEIANEIEDYVKSKNYIIVTCKYGLYLFSLYDAMIRANVYKILKEEDKVLEAINDYDKIWNEWLKLKEENSCCPTLFAKEPKKFDLIGYNWAEGFDSAIEPLR